jgi:hypothetical protein
MNQSITKKPSEIPAKAGEGQHNVRAYGFRNLPGSQGAIQGAFCADASCNKGSTAAKVAARMNILDMRVVCLATGCFPFDDNQQNLEIDPRM